MFVEQEELEAQLSRMPLEPLDQMEQLLRSDQRRSLRRVDLELVLLLEEMADLLGISEKVLTDLPIPRTREGREVSEDQPELLLSVQRFPECMARSERLT